MSHNGYLLYEESLHWTNDVTYHKSLGFVERDVYEKEKESWKQNNTFGGYYYVHIFACVRRNISIFIRIKMG